MTEINKKNVADGKNRAEGSKPSVHEILGSYPNNPFKTVDLETFQKRLSRMNLADMQALAVKVGLLPVHDRRLMKDRLTREFRKRSANIQAKIPPHVSYKDLVEAERKNSELSDILSQFRH